MPPCGELLAYSLVVGPEHWPDDFVTTDTFLEPLKTQFSAMKHVVSLLKQSVVFPSNSNRQKTPSQHISTRSLPQEGKRGLQEKEGSARKLPFPGEPI